MLIYCVFITSVCCANMIASSFACVLHDIVFLKTLLNSSATHFLLATSAINLNQGHFTKCVTFCGPKCQVPVIIKKNKQTNKHTNKKENLQVPCIICIIGEYGRPLWCVQESVITTNHDSYYSPTNNKPKICNQIMCFIKICHLL